MTQAERWWNYLGHDERLEIIRERFDSEHIIDNGLLRDSMRIREVHLNYFWEQNGFPIVGILSKVN